MDKTINLEITGELHGKKVDYILEKKLGLSTTLIRRLKRQENGILLNGKRVKTIDAVSMGELLTVNVSSGEAGNVMPSDIPLDILYEDDDIIAVNKPRSMPVHPSVYNLTGTLLNGLMFRFEKTENLHIITRLDKDTSGIVLIAKNKVSAAFLAEEIKNRRIEKEYIAAVNGVLNPERGVISAPIKKAEGKGISRCVSPDGKGAVTKYSVEKTNGDISLVRLYPVTGRTHQLRVHMSYVGAPIYGDSMYGALQSGEKTRLHCRKITFCHPESRKEITIECDIPYDIIALFK